MAQDFHKKVKQNKTKNHEQYIIYHCRYPRDRMATWILRL